MEPAIQIEKKRKRVGDIDVCIMHIRGHLDGYTCETFEDSLNSVLRGGCFNIIVDFDELTYISSAGLGALLNAHTRVREHRGDLKIARLTSKTKHVFDLLGFSHVLSVYESADEALRSFEVHSSYNN